MTTSPPPTLVRSYGTFVWHELLTSDPAAAKAFYGPLFGWTFEDMPMGDRTYTLINAPDAAYSVGGLMRCPDEMPMPPHWYGYVSVEDVDATAKAAQAAGGQVVVEPMDIPDVGRFAVILDPQGAVVAAFRHKDGDMPDSMPKLGEFCWDSLQIPDVAKAKAFYQTVFKYGSEFFGETTEVLTRPDGRQIASLAAMPPEVPAHWLTYVVVPNLEAANAKVVELGGKVVEPLIEVPTVGKMSVIQDPQGAFICPFEGLPQ